MSTGIAAIVVQFGFAMMPFGRLRRGLGVDLAHHERNLGIHPPGGGVVDDDRAAGSESLGLRSRGRGTRGEERDVDAGDISSRRILDGISAPAHGRVVPAERAEAK
jgi:hypothetical protein